MLELAFTRKSPIYRNDDVQAGLFASVIEGSKSISKAPLQMIANTEYPVFAVSVRPLPNPALPLPATKVPPVVFVQAVPVIGTVFVLSVAYPAAISSTVLEDVPSLDRPKPLIYPLREIDAGDHVQSPRKNVDAEGVPVQGPDTEVLDARTVPEAGKVTFVVAVGVSVTLFAPLVVRLPPNVTDLPPIDDTVVAQLPADFVESPVKAGVCEHAREPETSVNAGCDVLGTPLVLIAFTNLCAGEVK